MLARTRRLDGGIEREQIGLIGELANHGDELGDAADRDGQPLNLRAALAHERLGAHQPLDGRGDGVPVLRGDLRCALARVRRGAALAHHAARRGMETPRHLQRVAHLDSFLGDGACDVADRPRHRFAPAAERARRRGQGIELQAHAGHRLREWTTQIVDVQGGRELIGEPADERDLLPRVRVRLVMLQLEDANRPVAEAQGQHHDAAHARATRRDAFIAERVGDVDRDALLERVGAKALERRVERSGGGEIAVVAVPHVLEHAVVEPRDAELPPIHEPMGQRLDALEGIGQAHVRRHHLLHRQDLVELLGRDRLLEDPLEEQPHAREGDSGHEPRRGPVVGGGVHDQHGGDGASAERDDLVPQHQRLLLLQQLVAQKEREVQQEAAGQEVGEKEERERGKRVGGETRLASGQRDHAPGVHPERREQRQHLSARVDERDLHALAREQPVGDHDAEPHGERGHRRAHEQRARERRHRDQMQRAVLGERKLLEPHPDHRDEQHDDRDRLAEPARVDNERRDEEREPERSDGARVDPEERSHVRRRRLRDAVMRRGEAPTRRSRPPRARSRSRPPRRRPARRRRAPAPVWRSRIRRTAGGRWRHEGAPPWPAARGEDPSARPSRRDG